MTHSFSDQENYSHDEKIFSIMLETYTNLYDQAYKDKNYMLCQNLRLEISNLISGHAARIRLEDKLFDT